MKSLLRNPISGFLTGGGMGSATWRIERSYLVEGTCLTVSACIWNTGETLLAGREYCHNFFFFDEVSNGDSYTIKMRGVPDLHEVEPLLIIPIFIHDFLCIHPFNDGNGRMSRLLTTLLLYKNRFFVGKYISLEAKISKDKDSYYHATPQ